MKIPSLNTPKPVPISALNQDILLFFGDKTSASIKAMAERHMAQFVATMHADTGE